ncbi:MAG TPA: NADH-ubiquinone oxidoreductase-F iron-sulfur binding region domain-containing protein [Pelomicrobium sp.]|nr:NADH-ubiquinone oxidoreductase-F iron-sulfur binding region domain-containing protein [Pelomicrobium sp.]
MRSSASIADTAAVIAARHGRDPMRLLAILRDVRDALGGVPGEAVEALASALSVPRTQITALTSFYAFFDPDPHPRYTIRFSSNIIEDMAGKAAMKELLCQRLWVEPGKVSEDRLVYVGDTSCIGMGDQAPAVLVNGITVPRLTPARIDAVCEEILAGHPVAQWPAELLAVEDNVRSSNRLLDEPVAPGAGLRRAVELGPDAMLAALNASNLRGRGGAGYPTARKWASCRAASGPAHWVVCNADEGEPGTFKDRVLLTRCFDQVVEGMTLAAFLVGAQGGFVYLRGEYLYLLPALEGTLARRREANLLGPGILGLAGFDFDVEIVLGAGAYICGEETALIESLEGRTGRPRNRPPYPDTEGYRDQPTVVNNPETLAKAAAVAAYGADWLTSRGTPESAGTKLVSVSGDCERPGIYEVPFGVTVREVLKACGARETQAVQVSGPSGTCVSWREFDRRIAFEDLACAGAFMVFDRSRDLFEVARNFAHFFAHESCGFCTPCRVGTPILARTMDKLARGRGTAHDMAEMRRVSRILREMSHCALGHTAANPLDQTMEKFPQAYEKRLKALSFEPSFDLDEALAPARRLTGRDDPWAHLEDTP